MNFTRRWLLERIWVSSGSILLGSKAFASQNYAASHSLDKPSERAPGRFKSDLSKSKTIDETINAVLGTIDPSRMIETVRRMEKLGTRWTLSADASRSASSLVCDLFAQAGYDGTSVHDQEFLLPDGSKRRNIICSALPPQPRSILICGHYDSRSEDPENNAPGADDNASGVAVILEAARVLRSTEASGRIVYAVMGGEEQGLWGSSACAQIAQAENWPVALVLNLDMVGYVKPSHPKKLVVEFDQGNTVHDNDLASRTFGLSLAQVVVDYTTLEPEHTDIWNSDYMPFEAVGYPCIGLYDEAADEPFYHSTRDITANVSSERMLQVARTVVAFALSNLK